MIRVVGMGLEGMAGVSPRGRRLISEAERIAGSDRHLALVHGCPGELVRWDGRPDSLEHVLAGHERRATVLLASGDPNLFGVGATLLRLLGRGAVDIEPSVSSLQLALARAGVPTAGTALLSAHGRSMAAAAGEAASRRRSAILTDPDHNPAAIAAALAAAGVEDDARLVVCERLGGEGEVIREGSVGAPPPGPFDDLAIVVLDRRGAPGPGLGGDETDLEHDSGQVTKSEVRAISVAALDPGVEDVVWDVGAGSGSVAIEAGRLAVRGSVYAVERRPDRAERARRNAARSWNVEVITGEASEVLPGLPAPDAVFLGGGGEAVSDLVDLCVGRLRERSSPISGRLVLNLATLESVVAATSTLRRWGLGFRLSQVSVSRGRELGGRIGWEAQNPVHVLAARVPR